MYYLQNGMEKSMPTMLYRSGRSLHTAHFPAFQTGLHDTKQSVSGSAGCYGEIDITMNLLKDAMRIAPEMTIIVNGDDALSTYLAQESGNPYALTEFRSKYLKNKASTKSKKDVSAKNVEQNCFTISTITASSGTTTVQTVISTDQS